MPNFWDSLWIGSAMQDPKVQQWYGDAAGAVLDPAGAVDYYNRNGSLQGVGASNLGQISRIADVMNPANTPAQTALINQFYGQAGQVGQYNPNQASFGSNPQLDQAYRLMQGQAGGNDAVRTQQMGLIQQLQDQAAGRGPSLAQLQLQQASQQNLNQALSQQAAQRGLGRGAANRQMIGIRAGVGQNLAAQSAMARLQEQMAARGMLGQQLGGVRGQDMTAMNALAQQAEANRRAQMEYEQLRSQNQNAFNQTASQNAQVANQMSEAPRTRQQGNFNIGGNVLGSVLKMFGGGG